jgi:nucleoside phosphorylase
MNRKADVLLVTATQIESRAIFDIFLKNTGHIPEQIAIGCQIYHNLGIVNGTRVFMVLSEMGSGVLGGSQQTVQKGITDLSPIAVIMVGIAFGINPDKQSIGDVLVSQRLMPYDLQKISTKEGSHEEEIILRSEQPHASQWLFHYFRNAEFCLSKPEFKVRFGAILSGSKLVNNINYRMQLCKFEPEAIGGEMEGLGLYVSCQDAKIDWILVKAICDWADGNKDEEKDSRQQLAATNSASFVLHMLQRMPSIGKYQDPDKETPTGIVANLIVERLDEWKEDSKIRDKIIKEVAKKNKLEIAPHLRGGDLSFPLAMAMINLGIRKSAPILAGLCAHNLGSKNLKSILDLLAPIWVNLSAANCVSECALDRDHTKAVALNASVFDSAEMYVRRASCSPSGTWPIDHFTGIFGVDTVNGIVREIEYLLIPRILKMENYSGKSQEALLEILRKRLKNYKEIGTPVFIVLDYSKNISRLLPDIQKALPDVTLFLLTGDNLPQPIELGKHCKLLLPELGLEAEYQALDDVNFAYDFLHSKRCIE